MLRMLNHTHTYNYWYRLHYYWSSQYWCAIIGSATIYWGNVYCDNFIFLLHLLFFWFWVSQLLMDMTMTRRSFMIIICYYLKWAAILMSYLWMDFVIHILVKPRFEPCLRNWNVLLTYYFWIWIVIISENAYCLQAYCQLWTYILYLNCFGIEFFKTKFCDV